jgi:ribonuclease HII
MDPFAYDDSVRREGFGVIAGMDEAGRGPLAGPVVAAAVILPPNIRIEGVRDSKKIPEKEREYLFWEILLQASDVGIGIAGAGEIDRINILRATKAAMHRAITNLIKRPDIILIDALTIPSIEIKQSALIKGDSKSASIAAASIVAKVVRDRIMKSYHSAYPYYGFDRHKGYATRLHLDKIERHGPCLIHRKSFCKVKDMALF